VVDRLGLTEALRSCDTGVAFVESSTTEAVDAPARGCVGTRRRRRDQPQRDFGEAASWERSAEASEY
jgi:hypothetical protein